MKTRTPLETLRARCFTPQIHELMAATGWHMPGPLGWCLKCGAGTVWCDNEDQPWHPWCNETLKDTVESLGREG